MSENDAVQDTKNTGSQQRNLKTRHLNMISLGAAVGTGLFVGSAESIQAAGPAVLVSFAVCGFVVFLIMRMLGEMAVTHPISGSFSAYARKYLGPVAGFVTGWNWWYITVIVSMLELLAIGGKLMPKLFPGLPAPVTIIITLAIVVTVNAFQVRSFAETEYFLSLIKVVALVALILIGLGVVFFGFGRQPVNFNNLFVEQGFFPKGFEGVLFGLIPAVFSFGGMESLGMAAGEVENPEKSIPRAINGVIVRILLFYIGGVGVVLLLLPWNKVTDKSSPFVEMLESLGFHGAATAITIMVIVAAFSVLNTLVFSGCRALQNLAEDNQAPKFFARRTGSGIPLFALLFNTALVCICVFSIDSHGNLFRLLVGVLSGAQIISWLAIVLSHIFFVKRRTVAGENRIFPAPFGIVANIICIVFFAVLLYAMAAPIPGAEPGLTDNQLGLLITVGWICVLGLLWLGQKYAWPAIATSTGLIKIPENKEN